jgi:GH15 family glucan-1,4-alpha-glucosidase
MHRIEDYAIIGNCHTAALVSRTGSIDWMCLPYFDSNASFASLLGTRENGHWQIKPQSDIFQTTRHYREHTLILETVFETATGKILLTDCVGMESDSVNIFRQISGLDGEMELDLFLCPRFEYGSRLPWIKKINKHEMHIVSGPDQMVIRANCELENKRHDVHASFEVKKNDLFDFHLVWTPSHEPPGESLEADRAITEVENFWRSWINSCEIDTQHTPETIRSVLTLKALTFNPTGSILAALTTSLPESIGGPRNWDYRFCWPRDAALAIRAVINVTGQTQEIDAWRHWLLRATSGVPEQMEVLYKLNGHRPSSEVTLHWLKGFENSYPVRTGNNAHEQLQLDIYGSVIEVFYLAQHLGLPPMDESWELAREILKFLEKIWQQPDEGIWEVRGPKRHFVHGKLMVWAAFNWCIKAYEEFDIKGDVDHWRKMRDLIKQDICEKGFNKTKNSFTQYYGSEEADASLLLMVLLEFLPVDDPRIIGTIQFIEQELMLKEGVLMRYRPNPDVEGLGDCGKKAFLICSGWLGQVYMAQGRRAEAIKVSEKLKSLTNDVGLLAEQYDPETKRLTGNFPQAFSHIALIGLELAINKEGRMYDH